MKDFNIKPNHTQIPNFYLDKIIPFLKGTETKILLYICRRTFGFHRQGDSIAYSQFRFGVKTKDGVNLDLGTLMTKASIKSSLDFLVQCGILEIESEPGRTSCYRLILEVDQVEILRKVMARTGSKIELVRKNHRFKNCTASGSKIEPQVVQKLNTQKKEEIKGKKERKYIKERNPEIADLPNYLFEFWNSKNIITHRKLTGRMKSEIKKLLKDFSPDEIYQSIENYATIFHNPETYFKHKWTFEEFLSRPRGVPVFLHKKPEDYQDKNQRRIEII